jgi:hypothetical protein
MGPVVADLDMCGAKTSQGRSARRRRCSYQGFGGGLPAKAVSPSWTLDSPAARRVSSERVESAWVWLQHGDVMYHLVQSRFYSYFVERCADTRWRVVLQLLLCRAYSCPTHPYPGSRNYQYQMKSFHDFKAMGENPICFEMNYLFGRPPGLWIWNPWSCKSVLLFKCLYSTGRGSLVY